MSQNNLTVFQKLTRMFGFPGLPKPSDSPTFNFNNGQVLKTDDRSEYERQLLQAKQSQYIADKWSKLDQSLYNQSIYYEPNRLAAYYDYESMEQTPEISAALDIYSEESCTPSERGQILTVYSESNRIKNILENLFYNVLDVNTNLQMWARGMCKYGDDFVYLKILPDKGIVGCQQLPNIEIERIEGNSSLSNMNKMDNKNINRELRFAWKNKDLEFQSWEIAHFRLLGDDRKLPYGTSALDKIRRIWKQLLLAEDAMMIYRISRAPERRVFKVFVGNMDDKDIEPYVQKIANKFKRDVVADPRNGQVDLRYNQMSVDQDYFIPVRDPGQSSPIETLPGACISLDTEIPLLDGRILKLSEIISEWDNGNRDLWVYSADPNTGKLAPGIITWAGVTRKNTNVLKITLDNGEEIITTPDHKFVHRTNGFVEAQDLNIGDSLMPFYRQESKINKKTNSYEQIWDSEKQEWEFTHRMVSNYLNESGLIKDMIFDNTISQTNRKIIHHKDFNRFNNNPSNLVKMDGHDHMKYHKSVIKTTIWGDYELNKKKISNGLKRFHNNLSEDKKEKIYDRLKQYQTKEQTKILLDWNNSEENLKIKGEKISKAFTKERKEKFSKLSSELWKNDNFRKKVFAKKQTITFSDDIYYSFLSVFETNLRADKTLQILNNDEKFISMFVELNKDIRSSLTNLNEFTLNHVDKMLKQRGFKNFCEWKKNELKIRGFKRMVNWKYYVDKQNKYYNHKITNIEYLEEKIDTGTITVDGNEMYHNYHTFALKSGVFIKNSNLSEIADIEYVQKKLLAALRIPKAFLGFEEIVGEGKGLALMDIRFARTINRIQKSLIQELNKIALVHLYLLGLEDDLDNFSLSLTNPSSQSDLLKIEQWKEKITLYKDATSDQSQMGILPVSHTWAKKNILGMSESEVLLDLQQQRLERAIGFELTNSQNIIKRSGIFDNVDSKYGISEKEREELEKNSLAQDAQPPNNEMGGGLSDMTSEPMGDEPLSESLGKKTKKSKILGMLGDEKLDFNELFQYDKIQSNIYEIENKINEILNQ